MYRLITCPETAHLEMIDYEDTPFGMVIAGCSRFRPACAREPVPRGSIGASNRRSGSSSATIRSA